MSFPGSTPSVRLYSQGGGTASSSQFPSSPIIQNRDPSTNDIQGSFGQYPIGQQWINQSTEAVFTLVSYSSASSIVSATWVTLGGGSNVLETLTGDTGTATPSGGNIQIAGTSNQVTTAASGATVTLSTPSTFIAPGSIASTTTVTGGTGVTATTGNITATAGSVSAGTTVTAGTGITATTGDIKATAGQMIAGGDTGGVVSTVALTNGNSSTISTGVGSVKMSTANAATNTAWIKIYIGTSAYYVPAWTTNAP